MVNPSANTLGILSPNSYDSLVPNLISRRLMASVPLASRYRLVDFVLSSTADYGTDNISLIVRRSYHSLIDHLGSGHERDLTHKNGDLNLVPPFTEKTVSIYNGHVETLASILDFLKGQEGKYVVMADANLVVNFDFNTLIQAHMSSRADITVAYREEPLPGDPIGHRDIGKSLYYTLAIDNGRVTKMYMSSKEPGVQNFSMDVYIIDRELLIDRINTTYVRKQVFFERDILAPRTGRLNMQALRYDEYVARVSSMESYFNENMKMLDSANVDALSSAGNPICTKIHDNNPSRYISGSKTVNIMATDGYITEGEVENNILFRGMKIGTGAGVKNCVPAQGTVIEAGANVEYAVANRNVTIAEGKGIKSTDTFPIYVAKYRVV